MPDPNPSAVTGDDLRATRRARWRQVLPVLGAISVGGVLGSLSRYGVSVAMPHEPRDFAWATFGVNVIGCLLMGVLMALLEYARPGHPLLRPFLGIGVLGGFTTFSTYVVDTLRTSAEAPGTGLAYLLGTPLAALVAVWIGATLTRTTILRRRREPT
ncbi:fluoride efflux transporter FluC [Thermasporomyces composti]|jgi:CrcB protein|uniref:Fluoride-specific ion channel FluC n=1 Tax=Thermasporomyces composti TaxID=696763 RepID=A0A3D9VB22_THECX|nr:CrcB family protein [Thermasporomyces composti]REF36215.1 CrcB protein [Thermasporomyces composti]